MKKLTFEIYQDKKKEWRWRLKSRNGRIIAESGEGYKRKAKIYIIYSYIFTPDVDITVKVIDK